VLFQGDEIRQQIRENPDLRTSSKNCISCKQINLQDGKSNHFRCWNCKLNFCGHCNQKIVGPVGKHFSGQSSCPQHSWQDTSLYTETILQTSLVTLLRSW